VKHKASITLILLAMFLVTQLIGIYVINESRDQALPLGLDEEQATDEINITTIIFFFILAFLLFSFIMKYNLKFVMRTWFFLVIVIALTISLGIILGRFTNLSTQIAVTAALILAFFKVIKPSIIVHNFTELLIYPGIALILIPIINVTGMIILLILIAIYDAWAVWKSGIMQKMAKYQMQEVKVFGGFLIPSIDAKTRAKIKLIKLKYKGKKIPVKEKKKKYKVHLAILGGGDVVFPIITMGVFMTAFPEQILFGIPGLIPALFILAGSFLALTYLFLTTKKDKAYPAMPYITTGILLGLALWKTLF
jgi:presenilin-like A22 family membrane protease